MTSETQEKNDQTEGGGLYLSQIRKRKELNCQKVETIFFTVEKK